MDPNAERGRQAGRRKFKQRIYWAKMREANNKGSPEENRQKCPKCKKPKQGIQGAEIDDRHGKNTN